MFPIFPRLLASHSPQAMLGLRRAVVAPGLYVAILALVASGSGPAKGEAPAAQPGAAAQATMPTQAAKDDDGDDQDDDEADAERFPQPVRAGDLIGRDVIAPVESQDWLGRIRKVVKDGTGNPRVVMTFGGFFGLGGRLICVPLKDLALTGYSLQAVGIDPEALKAMPTCDGGAESPIDPNAVLRVGLAKPAH